MLKSCVESREPWLACFPSPFAGLCASEKCIYRLAIAPADLQVFAFRVWAGWHGKAKLASVPDLEQVQRSSALPKDRYLAPSWVDSSHFAPNMVKCLPPQRAFGLTCRDDGDGGVCIRGCACVRLRLEARSPSSSLLSQSLPCHVQLITPQDEGWLPLSLLFHVGSADFPDIQTIFGMSLPYHRLRR